MRRVAFCNELVWVADAVFVACSDEVAEERVRLQRLGLELGVELAAEEERMRR